MTGRACLDCGLPTGGPYARWCLGCRWRHRGKRKKYVWTSEKDDVLRRRYDGTVKGRASEIAATFGFPKWAVNRRARELGLSRPPETRRPWTAHEETFLEEHAGTRVVGWIAKKLRRSVASVALKCKREGIRQAVREGYTLRNLELCFGVDHHAIDRWIREGKLAGRRRYSNGSDRDAWRFTDGDVRRFILEHPLAFRLSKVDQLWFMDLLLGGKRGLGPSRRRIVGDAPLFNQPDAEPSEGAS